MNTDYVILARTATEARNHEAAYEYWSLALEEDSRNVEAWIGKGISAGRSSYFFGKGIEEAKSCLEQAIELGLSDENLKKEASSCAYLLADGFFDRANTVYLKLGAQGQSRVPLELNVLLIGPYLLRTAWQLEKSTERAKALIQICNSYRKRFGRQAGDFIDIVIQNCNDWVSKNDPNATAALPRAAMKPACFIATASYRSCNHPRVEFLQKFRDDWLLRKAGGRILVRIYYRFSPPVARLIENNAFLQTLSRIFLVNPVYVLSKILIRRISIERGQPPSKSRHQR